jgi:hypothetical protein
MLLVTEFSVPCALYEIFVDLIDGDAALGAGVYREEDQGKTC